MRVNWQNGTVALLVPHLIADHLLSGGARTLWAQRLDAPVDGLPASELLARWYPADGGVEESGEGLAALAQPY